MKLNIKTKFTWGEFQNEIQNKKENNTKNIENCFLFFGLFIHSTVYFESSPFS